jgi:HK97 gp10 family phage protein
MVTVKFEGIENLQIKLKEKAAEIEKAMMEGANEAADIIKQSAESKAPRKLGNLVRSIDKNEVLNKDGRISVYVGIQKNEIFSADGYYARMQEKGTSKMKAHPYLRPALDENRSRINSIITEKVREVIK